MEGGGYILLPSAIKVQRVKREADSFDVICEYLGVVDKQLELKSRYQSLGVDVRYGHLGRFQQRGAIDGSAVAIHGTSAIPPTGRGGQVEQSQDGQGNIPARSLGRRL